MVSKEHFKDNLITDSCIIDNVHELFVSVYLSYCMDLEKSLHGEGIVVLLGLGQSSFTL